MINAESQNALRKVRQEISKIVVGQDNLVEKVLIGLLCDGHILLEGLPGLAKTLTIKTLAQTLKTDFQRIQFTPDLLPSDLIGTMIYNPQNQEFTPKKGPLFTNILLADEINRAPAKVQSALLEAMGEKQVTIGETTFSLSDPFIVLATQNPLEQEGTYPLPEAQLDRFMMKVMVSYPNFNEEEEILNRMTKGKLESISQILTPELIINVRSQINEVFMDDKVRKYILHLIQASRNPREYSIESLYGFIQVGASPRATIALAKGSKCRAFMDGRDYVTPDDIKEMAHEVLRHRIIRTFEAEASEMDNDRLIDLLLTGVKVP